MSQGMKGPLRKLSSALPFCLLQVPALFVIADSSLGHVRQCPERFALRLHVNVGVVGAHCC